MKERHVWKHCSTLNSKSLRRNGLCREETEQDREARAPEQVVEWGDRVGARVAVGVEAVVRAGQVREGTAFVPAAVKRWRTNWEPPVMIINVPNAVPP
jgi:hypothetical protein